MNFFPILLFWKSLDPQILLLNSVAVLISALGCWYAVSFAVSRWKKKHIHAYSGHWLKILIVYQWSFARPQPLSSRTYKLISYLYLRNWIASAATLPLPVCPLLWLLFSSLLQFVPGSPQFLTVPLGWKHSGQVENHWPVFARGWNRDVKRKLKSPSFVELTCHSSASEIDSHQEPLHISLWQMSSCVDFRNLFDFCLRLRTYYMTQFTAVMVETSTSLQKFHLYLSQKAHSLAQGYPCV